MNITIYLNKRNSELIAQEPNKGGLINRLLTKHYEGSNGPYVKIASTPTGPNKFYEIAQETVEHEGEKITYPVVTEKTVRPKKQTFASQNKMLCEHGNMEGMCPICDVPEVKPQKPTPAQMLPKLVVDKALCPHGYARGFCKKADCNRKYAK
jgi:hypothetical protein